MLVLVFPPDFELQTEFLVRRVEYALDALIGRSREENELTGDTLSIVVTSWCILRTSSTALLCSLFPCAYQVPSRVQGIQSEDALARLMLFVQNVT